MTKKLGIFGAFGLAALALAICANGFVTAQGQTKTRIAIVNVQEVLKSYQKFEAVKEKVKAEAEQYDRTLKNKVSRLEELEKEFKNPNTTQERKDKIEREARTIKIEVEDIKVEARKAMQKLEQEHLAQIFKEVDQVVREYAKSNGIELVLRYAENWDKENYWKDPSVVQRFSMPFWPIYYEQQMEITAQISDMLNRKFAGGAKPNGKVRQVGLQNK